MLSQSKYLHRHFM